MNLSNNYIQEAKPGLIEVREGFLNEDAVPVFKIFTSKMRVKREVQSIREIKDNEH